MVSRRRLPPTPCKPTRVPRCDAPWLLRSADRPACIGPFLRWRYGRRLLQLVHAGARRCGDRRRLSRAADGADESRRRAAVDSLARPGGLGAARRRQLLLHGVSLHAAARARPSACCRRGGPGRAGCAPSGSPSALLRALPVGVRGVRPVGQPVVDGLDRARLLRGRVRHRRPLPRRDLLQVRLPDRPVSTSCSRWFRRWRCGPRRLDVCRTCTTQDCIRGNARQRGCELHLFQPAKRGNLDCTFCLDCVPRLSARQRRHPRRRPGARAVARSVSLVGAPALASARTWRRWSLVLVFGAFANAAGMVEPVLAGEHAAAARARPRVDAAARHRRTRGRAAGRHRPSPWSSPPGPPAAWRPTPAPLRALACRFAFALVPLGLSMWAAHFAVPLSDRCSRRCVPVVQRVAADLGAPVFGAPRGCRTPPRRGRLAHRRCSSCSSTPACWQACTSPGASPCRCAAAADAPSAVLAPWTPVIVGLWVAGVWIVFQPMQMRGMVH